MGPGGVKAWEAMRGQGAYQVHCPAEFRVDRTTLREAPREVLGNEHLQIRWEVYMGTPLIRNRDPLGPYSRTMPTALGGGAFFYERGTPVGV